MARKFIYYLKGFSRTIVLTDRDENRPIEEIVTNISKCMAGCKVSKFETDNDILIVRPSDIIGVHIAKDSSKHEEYDQEEPIEENIRLQSIVPDIDLGDIDDNTETEMEELLEDTVQEDEIQQEEIELEENIEESKDATEPD